MRSGSLVLPGFDDTASLGFPPRRVVYPLVQPWVTDSRFLAGNKEAELKPTIFFFIPTFPCFPVFPLLTACDIAPLIAACWMYSLIVIYEKEKQKETGSGLPNQQT